MAHAATKFFVAGFLAVLPGSATMRSTAASLQVNVINRADAPREIVDRAQEIAAGVFRAAGVEIVWLGFNRSDSERPPGVEGRPSTAFGPFSLATAGTASQQYAVTMVVGDYVGIDDSALRKAVTLAQAILHQAGVSTRGVLCGSTQLEGTSYGKCVAGIGGPALFVRIVSRPAPADPVLPVSMGMALPGKPGEDGTHAYVYYERVRAAGEFGNCRAFRILGHAIAHEIGHLLGNQHSTSGLMCPDWGRRALLEMSVGYLLFNPDEARRMRANVAARYQRLSASR